MRGSESRPPLSHRPVNGIEKDVIVIATFLVDGKASEIGLFDILSLGSCKRDVNDIDRRGEHETY